MINDKAFTELTRDGERVCIHYVFKAKDGTTICLSKLIDSFSPGYEMELYVNQYIARDPDCVELIDWYTCRFIDART